MIFNGGGDNGTTASNGVWNMYNRVGAVFTVSETTNHNYSSATLRYANNDSNNAVALVAGQSVAGLKMILHFNAGSGQSRSHIGDSALGILKTAINFTGSPINAARDYAPTHSGYVLYTLIENTNSGTPLYYEQSLTAELEM